MKMSEADAWERIGIRELMPALSLTMLTCVACMAVYQTTKRLFFPDITLLQSNVATVLFTSLIATIVAYFGLRKYLLLYRKSLREMDRQRQTEKLLRIQLDLAMALGSTNDLVEAMRLCLQAALQIDGVDGGGVCLLDDGTRRLTLIYHEGLSPQLVDLIGCAPDGSAPTEWPCGPEPVCRGDEALAQRNGGTGGREGLQSLVRLPLRHEGKTIGVLALASGGCDQVCASTRSGMEIIAAQTSGAAVRITAQQALQERRKDLQTLFETLEDCLFILDFQGNVVGWNQAVEKTLGYSADAIARMRFADFHPAGLRRQVLAGFADMVAGTGHECPLPLLRTDGRTVEMQTKMSRGKWAKQDVVFAISRDVTELRVAYQELDRYRNELETIVAARTAELSRVNAELSREIDERKAQELERARLEGQLRQAQKMEAIGVLAGGIAHDFNNLLTPILIHTELALQIVVEEGPLRHSLEQVLAAGSHAKEMVKQILTFSRRSNEELRPLHISLVVKEAVKLLSSLLPKNIAIRQSIEVTRDPWADLVLADPTQVHQVLMNLCSNAVHAMGDRHGVLEIRLTEEYVEEGKSPPMVGLRPGPYVRLAVQDTGHGMDSTVLEHIFDPFFTTKKPGEGTGLGLATVYGIVSRHHGAISVSSEPGVGTTFDILLPVVGREAPLSGGPAATPAHGSESILLVDDDQHVLEAGLQLLRRLGYQVTGEQAPEKALEAFRQQPGAFDLVVTDQIMPHLMGTELARQMLEIRPDVPVILCTGFADSVIPEELRSIGFRDCLLKPFVTHELAEKVRAVLDNN